MDLVKGAMLRCWSVLSVTLLVSLLCAGAAYGQVVTALSVSAPKRVLAIGESVQLKVVGVFTDGSTKDLTDASTGTEYFGGFLDEGVSVSVDANGLATAVANGFELVHVVNGSLSSSILLTVSASPDTDNDGLPDAFELANGLDANNPADGEQDADGDGLTNVREFVVGSDPHVADTDGDGLGDGQEMTRGTDPLVVDTDGDGLSDGQEVTLGTNPLDRDTDGDGISDHEEVAQGTDPRDPNSPGAGVVGPTLDERCTASVQNRTVQVNPDGTFAIPNVPVDQGFYRVRVVCKEPDGTTTGGQSAFVLLVPANAPTDIQAITLGGLEPIPTALQVTAVKTTFNTTGETAQLTVTGMLPDGTTKDLTTAALGTTYATSNPRIATVSADGLVTAVGRGQVILSARNEGVLAAIAVTVLIPNDADGDGLPLSSAAQDSSARLK